LAGRGIAGGGATGRFVSLARRGLFLLGFGFDKLLMLCTPFGRCMRASRLGSTELMASSSSCVIGQYAPCTASSSLPRRRGSLRGDRTECDESTPRTSNMAGQSPRPRRRYLEPDRWPQRPRRRIASWIFFCALSVLISWLGLLTPAPLCVGAFFPFEFLPTHLLSHGILHSKVFQDTIPSQQLFSADPRASRLRWEFLCAASVQMDARAISPEIG